MKVGMTGTRSGMTKAQKDKFEKILIFLEVTELHHGDCVGADADAHDIATKLGIKTVAHPPTKDDLRAYKQADTILPAWPYFTRNRHIVDNTCLLIGVPWSMTHKKGGTWYTIKYGQEKGPVCIISSEGILHQNDLIRIPAEGVV